MEAEGLWQTEEGKGWRGTDCERLKEGRGRRRGVTVTGLRREGGGGGGTAAD